MFINKAQNLEYLNSFKLKNIEVPSFIFFNLSEWKKNKQKLMQHQKHKESLKEKD